MGSRRRAILRHPGPKRDDDVLGTCNLGADERHHLRRHRRLDIAECVLPGPVDANENIGSALADVSRSRGNAPARALLFSFRNAVFEIQDDGIGAARVRLWPQKSRE